MNDLFKMIFDGVSSERRFAVTKGFFIIIIIIIYDVTFIT